MTIKRRDFLKAAVGSGALLATGTVSTVAEARGNKELPPKAVGLLFDSTLCVGCKACVAACKTANNMPAELNTPDQYWDTPLDLSGKTLNVIKAYVNGTGDHKDQETNGYAFIKKSCLHCVDPSCVSACPVSAMTKDAETGIVGYNADACIGCRYCVAACPFNVPRFEYDTPFPKIQKCQLCKHLQADGKLPACASVCPTGATIFGPTSALREEADRRKALTPGAMEQFPRRTLDSGDTHERPVAAYVDHVYGEKEVGGTQNTLLAGVAFDKLGYPALPDKSFASTSETIQHTLYGGLIAPVALFGGLAFMAYKNTSTAEEDRE